MRKILEIAKSQLGVHEWPDPGENPRILEYLRTTTLDNPSSDEIPWCSAFVNWVVRKAGLKGTDSALAASWLNWGEPVPVQLAEPGDIAVFRWASGRYHVSIVDRNLGSLLKCIGGNQSNEVRYSYYLTSRAVGIRRAKEVKDGS